jgi:glycosyltransferase involved in cell wall biosynthesis
VEQVGLRMAEGGHDVVVYCRSGHYSNRLDSYKGMRLRYLPTIRHKHLETLMHTAVSAVSLDRSSAVVCMGVGNAPVVRALELEGKRSVFNIDGADWQREKWGRFAKWYLRRCERMAANGHGVLVADAEIVQQYYRQQYERETELVAYGAEAPADHGTGALDRFGLRPDSYALFVGRLVPENGAHDFLAGVQLAKLEAPAVVVGGAAFERKYIQRLRATAPPDTLFTGYQFGPSYQQLTAHARVFVLAASVGGTHPVLVEQMAAGNCILARDTPSNREVLGDAGILWGSVTELADGLRTAWADASLREKLGSAAEKRVSSRYTWAHVTERYLELCRASLE